MNATAIGNITEHKFILYALKSGWEPHLSLGGNPGYDLVIRRADKWETVQVKTVGVRRRLRHKDQLRIELFTGSHRQARMYTKKSFDLLAAIYNETIWLIPMGKIDLSKRAIYLTVPEWDHYKLTAPEDTAPITNSDVTQRKKQKELF